MNKKRVALALAAALGFNTLVVTVGNIGGQLTVAHAQNARLINSQGVTLAEVKTLDTKVESVTKDSINQDVVTVSFPGLSLGDVSDITLTGATGNWDKTNGKLTITGLKDGVNDLKVKVDYVRGSENSSETYAVTLKKTTTEEQLSVKADVKVGTMTIMSAMLGTQNAITNNGETLEISRNSSSAAPIKVELGKEISFTNMKEGEVFTVVLKDKDGKEVARTQIVLTKQASPIVNAVGVTNQDSTKDTTMLEAIAKDYGVDSTLVKDTGSSITVDGQTVATYSQTVSGTNTQAGAPVNPVVNSNNQNIDITFGNFTFNTEHASQKTYVPSLWMKWGPKAGANTTHKNNGAFGQTIVTVGNQGSAVLYDASNGVTANVEVVQVDNKKYTVLNVVGVNDGSGQGNGFISGLSSNAKLTYNTKDLEHGYNSVAVEFTTKETPVGSKTINDWATAVRTQSTSQAPGIEPTLNTSGVLGYDNPGQGTKVTSNSVTTSIIVSKDDLDGTNVTSEFKKLGDKYGQLTLRADGYFTEQDLSSLVNSLRVNGSSSIKFVTGDKNSITFQVDFTDNVPANVGWKLTKGNSTLENTVKTAGYETVNAKVEVVDNKNAETGVYIDVTFSGLEIPTGTKLVLKDAAGNVVGQPTNKTTSAKQQFIVNNFVDSNGNPTLKTGNYVIEIGEGTNMYKVGVHINTNQIGLKIKAESSTSSGVIIKLDAFLNGKKPETIKGGRIEYRELTIDDKGTTDTKDDVVTKYGDWTDSKVTFQSGDFKEDEISKVVTTGLQVGKTYEFRAIYQYEAEGTSSRVDVYSNVSDRIKVVSSSSNNNSTITGNGSSSTTTGTSTGSTTITVTTSNSTLTGTSASVTLPSGFRYDSGKTPVAVTFKYKDKDGKIVTETKEQYSNVTARFNGNNVELNGLVPGKDYNEITVDYTDNNGKTRSIILKNVKTTSQTQVETYLANVYEVVFGRPADEAGYHFHLDNLKNKKVSLRDFLLNMLNEKEFVEKYKSTEEKIEALYNAIVNRTSDEAGKKFWVDEYKKVLAVYGSESTALRAIADRMVNENELKELADKMGVQW